MIIAGDDLWLLKYLLRNWLVELRSPLVSIFSSYQVLPLTNIFTVAGISKHPVIVFDTWSQTGQAIIAAAAAVDVQLSYYTRNRSLWKGAILSLPTPLSGILSFLRSRDHASTLVVFAMCFQLLDLFVVKYGVYRAYFVYFKPRGHTVR